MISVRNHRQLLSGNRIFFLLLMMSIMACSASKSVVNKKDVQIVKSDSDKKIKRDTIRPEDGVIRDDILKNQPKMDTVIWHDISDEKGAVNDKNSRDAHFNKKDSYRINMLIPLNSDEIVDPAASRFVQFYAGALLAFEELKQEGVSLNVRVIDTDEGSYQLERHLDELTSDSIDMIIGPFDRDQLRTLAEKCNEKQVYLVSPWQTSSKLTQQNPYYIQMKPNLREHFNKIVQYSLTNYKQGEVVLVGQNTGETKAWFQYFQDEAQLINKNKKEFFGSYFVNLDSLKKGPTAFYNLFKGKNVKAIILPNYSFQDESFVYSCLRRLAAEKGNKTFSVIGMPLLFDSDKVEFEFYHALQIKVAISDFVDKSEEKIKVFRRTFLDKYGEIPTTDAIRGYDLIMYMGRNLYHYGKEFAKYLSRESTSYLQSTYDIQRAYIDVDKMMDDPEHFDYYENKYLDIIGFKGDKWVKMD